MIKLGDKDIHAVIHSFTKLAFRDSFPDSKILQEIQINDGVFIKRQEDVHSLFGVVGADDGIKHFCNSAWILAKNGHDDEDVRKMIEYGSIHWTRLQVALFPIFEVVEQRDTCASNRQKDNEPYVQVH